MRRKAKNKRRINTSKYKQVGKICTTEWEAGPLALVGVLWCCGDAYKYTKIPNSTLISKHFRYSWSCLGAGGGLHDLLRPSQPLFSMILGGRNLHQLSWAGLAPERQEFKSGKKIDLIHFSSSPWPGERGRKQSLQPQLTGKFFLAGNAFSTLSGVKQQHQVSPCKKDSPPKVFIFPPT